MLETIGAPRKELKEYAPRIITIKIPTDKIRDVIGPGGKVIKGLVEETGADIDVNDDGTIYVAGRDARAIEAVERIKAIVRDVEPGEKYTGRVVSIQPFGAFIELIPGKDGLLHISKMAKGRIGRVEDVLNIGDEVEVIVQEIDDRGKVSLDLIEKFDVLRAPRRPRRAATIVVVVVAIAATASRDAGSSRPGGSRRPGCAHAPRAVAAHDQTRSRT